MNRQFQFRLRQVAANVVGLTSLAKEVAAQPRFSLPRLILGCVSLATACCSFFGAIELLDGGRTWAGAALLVLAPLSAGAGVGALISRPRLPKKRVIRRQFQFSLKGLLAITAFFGVSLGSLLGAANLDGPAMTLFFLEIFGAAIGAAVGIPAKRPVLFGCAGAACAVPITLWIVQMLR